MNRNFSFKGFQFLIIIIISGLLGYFIGVNKISYEWKDYRPILSIQSKNPPPSENLNMTLFYDVLDRVNRDYYDKTKVDSQKVLYGAITGMLQSLGDPYTSFFPPKENTSFKTQLAGEFSGIGAELGMSQDNRITVVSPLDDSPAQKAGVRSGDIILKVDGADTNGWTLPQAVDKIRGPIGSKVVLSILHEKDKNSQDLSIVRDTIVIKSVTGWVKNVECKDGKCEVRENCPTCASVAYIRLSQFGDKTNSEWTNVVSSLYSKIKQEKDFKGIVLDLRNNPGGYLNDAVFIASEFLDNGVIVMQEDSSGETTKLDVSRKGILLNYPLIVLVNKGSASASEIVAGALRDHNRAKLLGENSFGKGTIQQAVDIDSGASVHISVAKWLTPNGTWVNGKGLVPDVQITFDSKKTDSNGIDNQLQRALLELSGK